MDPKMLTILQCPVCFHYPLGNIFICSRGHSICCDCKSKLSECPTCKASIGNTRNYVLEELMQSCKFPCEFSENGCQQQVKPHELEEHKRFCEYRKYKCPFCSNWEGYVSYLKQHLCQNHKEYELKGYNRRYDTLFQQTRGRINLKFICHNSQLFYFYRHLIDTRIIHFVQYIGNSNTATTYSYKIEASCTPSNRRINWTEICANDLQTPEEIIQSGRYISIPADYRTECKTVLLELSPFIASQDAHYFRTYN